MQRAVCDPTTETRHRHAARVAAWDIAESTYVFTDTAQGDARSASPRLAGRSTRRLSPREPPRGCQDHGGGGPRQGSNPRARVLGLNLELGLGWYDSEAEAQAASPSLFIRDANGTVINCSAGPTMIQTFWDFREPNVTAYWLQHILAPIAASPTVDGVLFDDYDYNEHADVAKAAGIGPAEIAGIRAATFQALTTFTHFLAKRAIPAVYEGWTPPTPCSLHLRRPHRIAPPPRARLTCRAC